MIRTRWFWALLAGWLVMISISAVKAQLPAEWWYRPGAVHVEDAATGECPEMSFDRTIARPFYAEWVVTIMRRSGIGFYTYKTYPGENDYRPENELPDDLDLCWWAERPSVPLPPGDYRVHTLWLVEPPSPEHRQLRRTSNVFTIAPVPGTKMETDQ